MQITIRNSAKLPKKYLRFIKWKVRNIKAKFEHLIYVEVYLKSEGQSPKTYIANIRLGIPGHDIIIQNKSQNIGELLQKSLQATQRYLAKKKTTIPKKKNNFRRTNLFSTVDDRGRMLA